MAIDGTRANPPQIWNHVTGHWSRGAPLPEPLREIRLAELVDGRIVAAGEMAAARRARAYVADAHLQAWSILVDGPQDVSRASLVPTESGALLLAPARIWRYVLGEEGWHRQEATIPLSARGIAQHAWGDEVLLIYQDAGRWTGSIVGREGQLRPTVSLPNPVAGFGLISVRTAGAKIMWLLSTDKGYYLWRRWDEPPIALPPDLIALSPQIVATDDDHLLAVALSGALIEVTLSGIRPPGNPCDGLFRYLSETPPSRSIGLERALVNTACREDARRGQAPALLALVRSWATSADRADVGRAFECALQDEQAVAELTPWFRAGMDEHAKSVCYQSLATWPGTEGVWKSLLETAVYERSDHWYVDGAVIELASIIATPDVHERLLPAVRTALARHAVGFDALRSRVCAEDPVSSEARRQTCTSMASQHESDWRQQEAAAEAQRQKSASLKSHIPLLVVSTVVLGGAVGTAYATRDDEVSRGIAVASGALAGATIGFAAVSISALKGSWVSKNGSELEAAMFGGVVVGAALGGIGAYLITTSAAARAPVTGAALAIPYALILSFSFN